MPYSQTAETGFAAAAAYDTHRPNYSPESVSRFVQVLDLQDIDEATIVDLAAGSGKFTEALSKRPEKFKITAVEPHAGLREQLKNKNLSNVTVVEGLADNMSGIPDQSVSAVVAAQSFHWFANMDALKEINRVLRPTGVFGMIWNVENYNSPRSWTINEGWETVLREVLLGLDDGLPRFRDEQWKKVFDEQNRSDPISIHSADPLFGLPIGEDTIETQEWLSKEALWGRFQTYSQVANLKGDQFEDVKKTFWTAVDAPETATDDQGRVSVHGKTIWAWTNSIPGEPLQPGGRPN